MTVIRNNSISGINSITAQSGALNFYDSTGNTLSIGADVTGGVTVATGATISGSTNTIVASTNGSERLRITSTGNVGIGSDDPQAPLNVVNSNSTTPTAWIRNTSGGGDSPALRVQGGANNNNTVGTFEVRDYDGNVDFKVGGTGTVTIGNGNLVFSTSGTGIDFSATADGSGTTTSELLDDYEEGTWTPTLTNGYTYTTLTARYTKIGNVVYIYCNFYRNDSGTYTSDLEVTNLPFDMGSYTNSMGLGVADSYNGTSDRRHGHINSNNSNSVKVIKDGTTAFVSYDNFVVNSRNLTMKWWYYTA